MSFELRTQMLEDISGNFKNKFKNNKKKLKCQCFPEVDIMTQSHCVECPELKGLRKGLNLSQIEDLVKFFRKLMQERTNRRSA